MRNVKFNGVTFFEDGTMKNRFGNNKKPILKNNNYYVDFYSKGKITRFTLYKILYKLFIDDNFSIVDRRYVIQNIKPNAKKFNVSFLKKIPLKEYNMNINKTIPKDIIAKIKKLHAEGKSITDISYEVRKPYQTVQRYIND